jgi:hypothetical protein
MVHLRLIISSAHATRMKTLLQRCRKRKKTLKVRSVRSLIAHVTPSLFLLLPLALTFWQPSTSSQRERASNLSPTSSSPTPKRSLALQSPPPTKRPRRSAGLAPEPASGPLPAISRYKRALSVEPPALNAEFEIDSTANAGVPFAFDEVVRGRRHRHALNSGECEECREVRV